MAFKEAPKVDAKELYYHTESFIIRYVDDTVYGSFVAPMGARTRQWKDALMFEHYEDAIAAIKERMLEGVTVMKIHY